MKTATTGYWGSASTWSGSGGATSNATLIIPSGYTVTLNNDYDEITNVVI